MIGIRINSKRSSTIPGKIVAADVNWKLNAKNHFEAVHDRENNHPNYIQKDTLEKIWKTDYGVEYSRRVQSLINLASVSTELLQLEGKILS